MQKIYIFKTKEIIEVPNNAAHAIIESGEGELASLHREKKTQDKQEKVYKNKMQKTYKNKGI